MNENNIWKPLKNAPQEPGIYLVGKYSSGRFEYDIAHFSGEIGWYFKLGGMNLPCDYSYWTNLPSEPGN